MTVRLEKMVVDLPGQVMRKYSTKENVTTLVVTDEQAHALCDQLQPVLTFFDEQQHVATANGSKGAPKGAHNPQFSG